MSLRIAAVVVLTIVTLGFVGETGAAADPGAGSAETQVFSVPPVRPPLPTDVLAEVNGDKLLRADAEKQVELRMTPMKERIPAEKLDMVRNRILRQITQQFAMRTLLVQEADKRGIKVTPEDEQKALDQIAAKLPDGMTIDEAMKNSPMGEERMREELRAGVKIEKLIDQVHKSDYAVTDAQVDEYYQKNKDRLATPESVHARHILIGVDKNADAATRAAKRAEAEAVRKQLLAGGDFAELAKEHSTCPSKERGGDLGTFQRGRMVAPFDKAAFDQQVDEIGPVVETAFGYHIIQVLQHDEPSTLSRDSARELLENRSKSEVLQGLLEELKKNATIKPPTLFDRPRDVLPSPGSAAGDEKP